MVALSAVVLSATVAGACKADITKTGLDVTNGSTTEVAPGDTILWTINTANYDGATSGAYVYDFLTAPNHYVAGSWTVPAGWTPEWTTDGGTTWVTAEPPASAVNGVGATHQAAIANGYAGVFTVRTQVGVPANTSVTVSNKAKVWVSSPNVTYGYAGYSQKFHFPDTPVPGAGFPGLVVVVGIGAVSFGAMTMVRRRRHAAA